ncbi:putative cytochrome P450 [Xylariaceae sp. FL1272]|nr:putative cytochrome P450 [Xylariaceae sp. FL1272]
MESHCCGSLRDKLRPSKLVLYVAGYLVYNLFFHPLRKFPGPLSARASLLWRLTHSLGGKFHRHIEACHEQYGDVVRVSPNELSFCTASAWGDIYTPNHKGIAKVPKNEFYQVFGLGFEHQSIGTERDPTVAHQKRALFSQAFSAKGLAEQEPVMQRNVDAFIDKLGKLGGTEKGIDMTKWFIFIGFDVLGEMAFGESFGCVEREASHPWLDVILGLVHVTTIMDNLRRYPFLVRAAGWIPSKWTIGFRDSMIGHAQIQTKAQDILRLQKQITNGNQGDFVDVVAEKVLAGKVELEEMEAHAWNLAMAGGETTGSSMASILYFVLKDPIVYQNLSDEVRAAFDSYESITVASVNGLSYLRAVLKEGLRIFPTAPQGTPRKSPGVMVDGHFIPEGVEVYVSPWAATHSKRFWKDPYVFRPERWTDPDCTDIKAASQPFSVGPRACPGKLFAYAKMSLQLAKMFYTYDMELVDPELDWINTCQMHFLWWKPELYVRFKPRAR